MIKLQNISLVLFFIVTSCFCQDASTAKAISKASWEKELTEIVKQEMEIQYPIFKVFEYEDLKGRALIVLTESNESVSTKGEPVNLSVAAFLLRASNGRFTKEWENTHDIKRTSKTRNPFGIGANILNVVMPIKIPNLKLF